MQMASGAAHNKEECMDEVAPVAEAFNFNLRHHGLACGELDDESKKILKDPEKWLNEFGKTWQSYLKPPPRMWDEDDLSRLDRVKVDANIKITAINPKNGQFEARMICHWELRTLNSKDRTRLRVRVPGLRVPGLMCTVEESRLWRDDKHTTDRTIYWQGTTVMVLAGYELFNVREFPFDRQVLDFDIFDFVWRSEGDADGFDEAMKVVSFNVVTHSMLPEWKPYKAMVIPLQVRCPQKREADGRKNPESCSRFAVKLRLQRNHRYYITQVFLVTYAITCVSLFPLGLAMDIDIGNRFAIMSGGLLTLTAFKYTVADQLPSVPYTMFMDKWLVSQILWVCAAMFQTLFAYKVYYGLDPSQDTNVTKESKVLLASVDLALLVGSIIFWTVWLAYIVFVKAQDKNRSSWIDAVRQQADYHEQASHDDEV